MLDSSLLDRPGRELLSRVAFCFLGILHLGGPRVNPYEPPTTVNDSYGGFLWSIRLGVETPQVVSVSGSLLRGIRTYVTDADGNSGPVHRGPVEFEVGQQQVHSIRIEVDDAGKVNTHVDDTLVESNLFPELQDRIQKIVWAFVFVISAITLCAIFGGVFYFFEM